MLHIPELYIIHTEERGRGVFCAVEINAGDIIEACPIIKIPHGQLKDIDKTIIYEYYFLWEEAGYEACVALGYGSLYNHHPDPNAEAIMDYNTDEIIIRAKRDIMSGQEILINYSDGDITKINEREQLWFDVST